MIEGDVRLSLSRKRTALGSEYLTQDERDVEKSGPNPVRSSVNAVNCIAAHTAPQGRQEGVIIRMGARWCYTSTGRGNRATQEQQAASL